MPNDFSSDSAVKAVWRFSPGGLTTDSKGTNHLTAYGSPSVCTTDYVEGAGSLYLPNGYGTGHGLRIADASLSFGFPLKSGDATKTWFWSMWFKLDYLPTPSAYLLGKWGTAAASRSFLLYIDDDDLKYAWPYNSTTAYYRTCISNAIVPGVWYWVGCYGVGATNRIARVFLYNSAAQSFGYYSYAETTDLYVGAGDFCIGCSYDNTYNFPGLIDEVVVRSSGGFELLDVVREGRFTGSGDAAFAVTNTVSGDSSCKAFWRFEPGGLTTDSQSTNHLTATASSPTSDTTLYEYFEGTGSAKFVDTSSQSFYITDANLSAGFPLKSGDTTKTGTWCWWFRPETIPGSSNWDNMVCKGDSASNKRSLQVQLQNGYVYIFWYYSGASSVSTYFSQTSQWDVNTWYFISIAFDGVNKFLHYYMYGYYRKNVWENVWWPGQTLQVTDGAFSIGSDFISGAPGNFFNGEIDGLLVFNRVLTSGEIAAVMRGKFSDVHQSLQLSKAGAQIAYRPNDDRNIWCVNPSGVYTADRSLYGTGGAVYHTGKNWDQALHTWKNVAIPSNDIILCRKSDQVVQTSATATATVGSRSVSTSADMTGSLSTSSIIRFDNDDALFAIRAITSNTISLYRPYRGTTGAGKTVNKLLLNPGYDLYYSMWALDSLPGQTIDCRCGVNIATNQQDGFTVFDSQGQTGYYGVNTAAHSGWKLSRFGWNYGGRSIDVTGGANIEIEKCYAFRYGAIYIAGASNLVARELINDGSNHTYSNITDSQFYDCEAWVCTTSSEGLLISDMHNVLLRRFYQGHARSGLDIGSNLNNVVFENSIFGEGDTTNSTSDLRIGAGNINVDELVFRDTSFKSTNLYYFATNSWYVGTISFENFAGVSGDHRRYIGRKAAVTAANTSGWSCLITPDNSTYHTGAPSVKLAFNSTYCSRPIVERYVVPVDANTYRTISVYMRKNSSYGSQGPESSLPFMVVTYPTVVAGVTTWTNAYATMPDTSDTWSLLSCGITSCMTAGLDVELHFWSRNSGAIVWYDDFSVTS